MPVYEFECAVCGAHDEYLSSVAERRNTPACAACGGKTEIVISAVAGVVRFPAAGGHDYISPASGKVISTQKARREDLKRTGCRPYEGFAAEKKEADKVRAEEEKKSDAKLHDNVSRAFHQLSPEKRKHLTAG